MTLPSIHSLIHSSMGIVGVLSNSLLLVAIILSRKNVYLQTYSLLLFNTAVTDLIACLSDSMTMLRIVVEKFSIVYIYNGPCGNVSANACHFLFGVMLHLEMHSIALIAISFWYRSIALSRPTPSVLQLQLLCLAVLVPSVLKHIDFQWAAASPEDAVVILHSIYPDLSAENLVIIGQHSTIGPHNSSFYICILPVIAYSVIRKMAGSTNMSEKTKEMHAALVRALTVHALLPISLCSGLAAFLLLTMGVPRNELLERFSTMGLTFPSATNPILTLYFVAPLRNSISRVLKINLHKYKSQRTTSKVSTVSSPKVSAAKSTLQ